MVIRFTALTRLRLYSCLHESSSPDIKLFFCGDSIVADCDQDSFSRPGLSLLYFPRFQSYATVSDWHYDIVDEYQVVAWLVSEMENYSILPNVGSMGH